VKCVYAGKYNPSGNIVTPYYNPNSITVTPTASGAAFTLAHGLNTTNYFATFQGIGSGFYVSIQSLDANSVQVVTGFGGSVGTAGGFYFQIFKY
jgi:hypothetical protein